MKTKTKKSKIIVTWGAISPRKKKKVSGALVKKVMKDKDFKKTVDKMGKKISRDAARVAVRVAVEEALNQEKSSGDVVLGRSGLEIYTDLVNRFSAARKKRKKKLKRAEKKKAKWYKKHGGKLNRKTGLVRLRKADKCVKLPKAKKLKYLKRKK